MGRRSRVHLGSFVMFCDVAGRVTRDNRNPLATAAVVAIPVELLNRVRGRLSRAFEGKPVKFKHGGLAGFSRATNVVVAHGLWAAVAHIHRATPDEWRVFWDTGAAFVKEAEKRSGETWPEAEGQTLLRMRMLAAPFATFVGHLLALAGMPKRSFVETGASLHMSVINDMEIQNAEARKEFAEWVAAWPETSGWLYEQGVVPEVRADFATDKDEPLLHLPDYVAGMFHHADPRAVLDAPVISRDEAAKAIESFRAAMGSRLAEAPNSDFKERYPLAFQGDDVVNAT